MALCDINLELNFADQPEQIFKSTKYQSGQVSRQSTDLEEAAIVCREFNFRYTGTSLTVDGDYLGERTIP